jgi:pyridoxine kinase
MNILSVQSWVAYGHVGNASAVFPLQRLGAEVWAIHTVQFSNHTGYGGWTGQVFTGEAVSALVGGIGARGVLGECDAVLSGYMGDASIGEAILGAVSRVRQANPAALYACDPVIGDEGRGVFVRPGIPELIRDRALAQADIATPNQFELSYLTGLPITTIDDAKRAVVQLRAMMRPGGPRVVLVTSLRTQTTASGSLDLLASAGDGERFHLLRTPLLPLSVSGAGDAIAALFLFHWLRTGSAAASLEAAGSAIWGVLKHTAEAGSAELQLVAAQAELVSPSRPMQSIAC